MEEDLCDREMISFHTWRRHAWRTARRRSAGTLTRLRLKDTRRTIIEKNRQWVGWFRCWCPATAACSMAGKRPYQAHIAPPPGKNALERVVVTQSIAKANPVPDV